MIETLLTQEEQDENRIINKDLIIWILKTVINQKSGEAVAILSQRVEFEQRLQSSTESTITGTLGWVKGEVDNPRIFSIIPTVDQIENIERKDFFKNLLVDSAYEILGFSSLPTCPDGETTRLSLSQIRNGNWLSIICTSDRIRPAIIEKIESTIPNNSLEIIEERVNETIELYRLDILMEGFSDLVLSLSKVKEQILAYRQYVHGVRYIAIFAIIMSGIFSGIAYVLSPRRSTELLIKIGLFTGILLTVASIISNTLITRKVLNQFNYAEININSEAISLAQEMLFQESLFSAIYYIANHLNDYAFKSGIILTVVFIVLFALSFFRRKDGKKEIVKLRNTLKLRVEFVKAAYNSKKATS